jgi:hypothetical protein
MFLHPVRRLFVLLGAYEDLTERESGALRRGDVEHAITIENRKIRLAQAMADARRNAELSPVELDQLTTRVRGLEQREHQNSSFLREEMGRVRAALGSLYQVAQRSRQVRRGYGAGGVAESNDGASVLGKA